MVHSFPTRRSSDLNVAINPDPFLPVEADSELILIGSPEAELSFSRTYL